MHPNPRQQALVQSPDSIIYGTASSSLDIEMENGHAIEGEKVPVAI